MPTAAMVAMKPGLEQITCVAAPRLIGAVVPANEHNLRLFAVDRGREVVVLVLFVPDAAMQLRNRGREAASEPACSSRHLRPRG